MPEAIAKCCPCSRWMMVELVLEAAMARKADVSSVDVTLTKTAGKGKRVLVPVFPPWLHITSEARSKVKQWDSMKIGGLERLRGMTWLGNSNGNVLFCAWV